MSCANADAEPDAADAVNHATRLKAEGNTAFKIGEYNEALAAYTKAIHHLMSAIPQAGAQAADSADHDNQLVILWSNGSEALCRLGEHQEAADWAQAALALDPGHKKSLARKGKAEKAMREQSTAGTVGDDIPSPQHQDDAQAARQTRQAQLAQQEAQAARLYEAQALQQQLADVKRRVAALRSGEFDLVEVTELTLGAQLLVAGALGDQVAAQQVLEELHPSAKECKHSDAEQCEQRYSLIETLVGSFVGESASAAEEISLFPPAYQRPTELLSNEFSGSPLLAAANGGHTGCAKLFCDAIECSVEYVQHNSNPQGKLEYRFWQVVIEAMRLAAHRGTSECLETLLVFTFSAGGRCIDWPTKWLIRNMMGSSPINDTASPVFAAAEAGNDDCVELLLSTGMIKRDSWDLIKAMLRAVELGHLQTVQMLSSYSCMRTTVTDPFVAFFADGPLEPEFALEARALENGHTEIAAFLQRSREWTPLHHLEVLPARRAKHLLRMKIGVTDPPNDPHAAPSPSPLERVLGMLPESSQPPVCDVIRLGAAWSAESHELFPRPARRRAVRLRAAPT